MKLLVLGGTGFLGRVVAAHAVAAGHRVTCAARGVTGDVPPGATLVRVDRDDPDGLAALDGLTFDSVIDIASKPSRVRRAVEALRGRVGHWTYVSSGSAYAETSIPGQRATTGRLLEPAPPEMDDPTVSAEVYGRCKVACEQAVLGSGVPVFIRRAGLIVGPGDPTDRFTYWPVRLARGGEVLAPGAPDELVQFVDVRDLSVWLVDGTANGLSGVYDGIGAPMPRGEFLTRISAAVGRPDPQLTWVGQEFLAEHGVNPWAGERSLPLWLPLPEYAGFLTRDASPALAAGLAPRDLAETARDTLSWYTGSGEPQLSSGLTPDDEAVVLASWHARS
ncbi:NAD-dependent epimerase/dehydratase family protein [Rugosimonospora africana]|uniref:Reductase n=1 Tax=Rugosimonospora africana TaxID=556532 RepID=A0A8J3VW19_9ACTN|nr:NAD-dependent epimerase/dehydratase family protein [Rugosimonospora africana]GIH20351.1 reductase [Rugosimonospora africana]